MKLLGDLSNPVGQRVGRTWNKDPTRITAAYTVTKIKAKVAQAFACGWLARSRRGLGCGGCVRPWSLVVDVLECGGCVRPWSLVVDVLECGGCAVRTRGRFLVLILVLSQSTHLQLASIASHGIA